MLPTTLRARFWLEALLALITGLGFLVTLARRNWIEIVFHVDPDRQSGALEWTIIATLLVATVVSVVVARQEWRRAALA